jgi:hypothetical protein
MNKTRCKFRINEMRETTTAVWDPQQTAAVQKEVVHITAAPVYDNSNADSENARFFAATPSGQFSLYTVNKDAVQGLAVGTEIYIDISVAN